MAPSKLRSVAATALAAKSALMRFQAAASEVWPNVPPINSKLAVSLTNIGIWAEKGGRGMPEIGGLQGLFLDPVVRVPAAPAHPLLAEASIAAVMGQLGAKGGASKSERKIAAAKATLAILNAAKAQARAKR